MDMISQNNSAELPNGKANENFNPEFKKIVEKSRENIQEAATQKENKRGRGRPKKIRPEEEKKRPEIGSSPSNPTISAQPAPDISQYLKNPIQFVSKIPAAKYQIPELAFSDDEATACAESINGILQAFVPDQNSMDPKTASILSLGMVVGSIGFQKYMIYMSHLEKIRKIDTEKNEVQNEALVSQIKNGTSVNDYFNTIRA